MGLKGWFGLRYLCNEFWLYCNVRTGHVNVAVQAFNEMMALSSGNSLFVSSRLLKDPAQQISGNSVTQIIGKVERPGISPLIPPSARPFVRDLSSSFRAVRYARFDGTQVDNSGGTYRHLSFTKHEFPLDYGVSGIFDHHAFVVKAVVSVHDEGEWVADLDILRAFDKKLITIRQANRLRCRHNHSTSANVAELGCNLISVDSWEEVLDIPPQMAVVRTSKNWVGRLAAAIVLG